MAFTHLHVHTEYSLLDGSGKIPEMAAQAKALGMDSLAITDHGVMFGVIDFYKACKAQGIKPIIGCEIYVTTGSRFDREAANGEDRYYHLILLAENNKGYENLMKIVSVGFVDGYYYKPRVDYETLEKYSDGIIALSACLAGLIPRLIQRGKYEEAKEEALRLQRIFGRGNFYLELQDHGIAAQKQVNSQLLRMSEETDIPLVCTNDVHYTYDTDVEAHDILLCIQTGKKQSDQDRMRYEGGQFYLKSPEEMKALFPYAPEALINTQEIAERCNVEIEFGVQKLPKYDVPEGFSAYEYLEKLCEEGLRRKYENYEEHEARLHYELDTIKNMGYVDYFLIVWDFINYAKRNGIMVGPGRGSAAGSLVSYALEITEIDPIKYSLIFERFLNPERVSMPDIDVDFADSRRGEVIEYVNEKYGHDCVSQIVTFGTMAARNAIRDVGRVIDMPYGVVDSIAKMVPQELGITIDKTLSKNAEFKHAYDSDSQIRYLIDMAKRLEGLPRHSSKHAAGVVICARPVMDYVPLSKGSDGIITTQYTMTALEELGLLKMDFLGLTMLTVIQDAVNFIQENTGQCVDLQKIDYNDKAVLSMIGQGKTDGVFQLESPGMTGFMRELKPESLEDIIAGIALYRPGPMDFIPKYLKGKNSAEEVVYDCPQLKHILEPTYGCIVYQEQVMQIVRDLAGYTMGGSDVLRRAMSKKKDAVMQAERKRFVYGDIEDGGDVKGCVRNGISEEVANKIYDEMIDFAKYAFNKSHAAAYAIVSYQTAYLKYYYPVEYMAALMTSVSDTITKLTKYTATCKEMGIHMLKPDINKAMGSFSTEGENIRYGLSAIKGVGKNIIDQIIEERERDGDFTDLYDFVQRLSAREVNKRTVESFIKAGCFDSFGLTRKQLICIYMEVIDEVNNNKKSALSGQISLFDLMADDADTQSNLHVKIPDVGEFDKETLLAFEKDVTGIYISGHPLEDYAGVLKANVTAKAENFMPDDEGRAVVKDKATVTVGGIVTQIANKTTRKGQAMAIVELEDMTGKIEVVVFPREYAANRQFMEEGAKLLVRGSVSLEADGSGKLVCSQMTSFEHVGQELWIRFADYEKYAENEEYIERLFKEEDFRGDIFVIIYLEKEKQKKILGTEYCTNGSDALLEILKIRFGEKNVILAAKKI